MSSDSDGGTIQPGSPPPPQPTQPDEVASSSSPELTQAPIEPPGSPLEPAYVEPSFGASDPTFSEILPPEPQTVPAGEAEKEKKQGSFFKELPILILIAFGLALLIKSFLIQAFYIPSESMVPTLNVGDRVLVNKVVYKVRDPRRGEVIVFVGEHLVGERSFWQRVRDTLTSGLGGKQGPERDFIKRIIGLPGETVEGVGGRVVITPADGGAPFSLDEPYQAEPQRLGQFGPTVVPKDSYFVMGDNRNNSSDSRSSLGPIQRKEIVGRAFVRVWPLSRFHRLSRPDYTAGAAFGVPLLLWAYRRRRRERVAA